MLVSVPHVLLIFDTFDHLLKSLSPELFPIEWWNESDNTRIRQEIHAEIIASFNEHGLYFPVEHFRDGSLQHVKMYNLPVDFHCIDFNELTHFAIPLFYWSNGIFRSQDEISKIVEKVGRLIQAKYSLTDAQRKGFLEHHLVMTYLIQQFSRDEKWGAEFFTNDYPIILLQRAFQEISPIQARRFYYWGILRFRVSDQIDYWISPDAFEKYLSMFRD